MLETQLKERIKQAFKDEMRIAGATAADSLAESVYERIAAKIADAIYQHVEDELTLLKERLLEPGAFTGSGTGTVVISPGTITSYEPSHH